MDTRSNDTNKEKAWFRTNRYSSINGSWYFATREGQEVGPFKTKKAAESGLTQFVVQMKKHQTSAPFAASSIVKDPWSQSQLR